MNSFGPMVQPLPSTSMNSDSVPAGSRVANFDRHAGSSVWIVLGGEPEESQRSAPNSTRIAAGYHRSAALAARFCGRGSVAGSRNRGGSPWQRRRTEGRGGTDARERRTLLDRDAQGPVDAHGRRARGATGSSRARISSATSCTTRCSIRATARRCSPPRAPGTSGPTVFRSTDRGRTWKEAAHAAGVRSRQRAHASITRSGFTPGHRERARRLVRRHLAAGTVPLDRRRRQLVRASAGFNAHPEAQGVVRRRPGRHARTARSYIRS